MFLNKECYPRGVSSIDKEPASPGVGRHVQYQRRSPFPTAASVGGSFFDFVAEMLDRVMYSYLVLQLGDGDGKKDFCNLLGMVGESESWWHPLLALTFDVMATITTKVLSATVKIIQRIEIL